MKGLKRQSGVVLFFALILLIVMTVIGVALAVNSGQSLRMAGAGSERIEAKAAADGILTQVIVNNSGTVFANLSASWSGKVTDKAITIPTISEDKDYKIDSITITPMPATNVTDVSCQRTVNATSANLISCRRIEVTNSIAYGRDKMGSLTVTTGVEQQVLTGN